MCCRIAMVFVMGLALIGALAQPSEANAKSIRLAVPEELVASGFLKHLLPRFSLKTGIRFELLDAGSDAEARLSEETAGLAVFSGAGKDWFLSANGTASPHLVRFQDWITGDIGRRTIESFKPNGKSLFIAAVAKAKSTEVVAFSGDVLRGEKLAVLHCGRCHMVNEATRLTTIGSSPSFAVMRSFADWQDRFQAFFALNPHPSFTQVDGITEPFDPARPSPIAPLEITLTELDAILAFVSRIPPADLGAPIQYQ